MPANATPLYSSATCKMRFLPSINVPRLDEAGQTMSHFVKVCHTTPTAAVIPPVIVKTPAIKVRQSISKLKNGGPKPTLALEPLRRSAGVLACEFTHRPGTCSCLPRVRLQSQRDCDLQPQVGPSSFAGKPGDGHAARTHQPQRGCASPQSFLGSNPETSFPRHSSCHPQPWPIPVKVCQSMSK